MSKTYEIQPIPAFSQRFPQEQSTGQIADVKESAYALAETSAYCDLLRVALAKQVMDNTAILATIEGHYPVMKLERIMALSIGDPMLSDPFIHM